MKPQSKISFALAGLLLSALIARPAHALDKRLQLMFKTAGYGAAAGGLIGGAFAALGAGDAKNIFMGASSGMYAGILLAAYIVATPPERDGRRENPYAPKRPVGPSDWKNEEWDEEEFRNGEQYSPDHSLRDGARSTGSVAAARGSEARKFAIWVPLMSVGF